MRRRLTVAVVLLLAGSLLLAGVGTLLITRADAKKQQIHQLQTEAQAIATAFEGVQDRFRAAVRRQVLITLAQAAHLEDAQVISVLPDGSIAGSAPQGLTAADLDTEALRAGQTVTGGTRSLLFAAVPIHNNAQAAKPRARRSVVVFTEPPGRLGPSWVYFLLVAAGTLLVGAVVAARLASRAARPLRDAVAASRKIAAGDLDARVPVDRRDYPEVKSLAESINSMAAALDRSRGLERQFLMSVSHDLRTPLTSIRGFAEAISEGAAPDEKKAAGVIASESRRLERLVGDLLDLARLDARRFTLHLGPVEVSGVAADTAAGFRPALQREGLVLALDLPDDPLWARADPDRLAQVLANLLENAFGFASARVRVTARRAGASAELSVDDDGPGIPTEELDRVFARLYQSSRPAARRTSGSGLGLAIVAELVEAMGGTVSVQSPATDSQGTRVTVCLPAVPEPPPRAEPRRAESLGTLASTGGGRHDGAGNGAPGKRRGRRC